MTKSFVIKYTSGFKKSYKRVKKSSRWQPIFNQPSAFQGTELSSWLFVLTCFRNNTPIPEYFYEHQLTPPRDLVKQLKRTAKNKVEIHVLDLHLDGHNGDHLLIFSRNVLDQTVTLINIGTHSDLFG